MDQSKAKQHEQFQKNWDDLTPQEQAQYTSRQDFESQKQGLLSGSSESGSSYGSSTGQSGSERTSEISGSTEKGSIPG